MKNKKRKRDGTGKAKAQEGGAERRPEETGKLECNSNHGENEEARGAHFGGNTQSEPGASEQPEKKLRARRGGERRQAGRKNAKGKGACKMRGKERSRPRGGWSKEGKDMGNRRAAEGVRGQQRSTSGSGTLR